MAFQGIRPLRIEGNLAYVPLTFGYEAVIDLEDVPAIQSRNWYALRHRSGRIYATTRYKVNGKWFTAFLHRIVLVTDEAFDVDHDNGVTLDCRLANLRQATRSQNIQNTRRRSNNKSGFKGVSREPGENRWRADIKIAGKTRYLGSFLSPEAAHEAYKAASQSHFGEFANAG